MSPPVAPAVSDAAAGGSPLSGLAVDEATAAAARAGVRAGDRIVAIDGRPPEDVLDLELAAADGRFTLDLERDRRRFTVEVGLRRGEEHGVTLHDGLGVPVRRCANDCLFCFVSQLPPGLRASLYVRDDDYRLSFLQGTFITLTNLSDHDLQRIVALRLSPLYVSLHAWDDTVRARLMGPGAGPARALLTCMIDGGIEVHVQIVLCPGVNDGALLRETVRQLGALARGRALPLRAGAPAGARAAEGPGEGARDEPRDELRGGVVDIGVVPVSLSHESPGLRRVTAADAAAAVTVIEELQAIAVAALGRRFVHAADELYLLAGRLPPPADAPSQYENGIGVCAALLAEADRIELAATGPSLALLGGRAAAPVLAQASRRIATRTGAAVRPFIVANRLFGETVTVTGLLGGREVVAALRGEPLAPGEWLLAPRAFLPAELGRTLDDVGESELSAACDGRLALGDDLSAAVAAAVAAGGGSVRDLGGGGSGGSGGGGGGRSGRAGGGGEGRRPVSRRPPR